MQADMHIHGMGHGERRQTAADLEPFIFSALAKGLAEIGFNEHDWVQRETDFEIFRFLQKKYPQIKIRVGLEVDHLIGQKEAIKAALHDQPFDYLLGGVHHIGADNWPFDMPDYKDSWQGELNIDQIYQLYFASVEDAAASGLYQVLPHLDVIKLYGFRPSQPVLTLMGSLLETIREESLVVEINTAGLFKPVGEIYPQREILAACCRMEIPVTFGSDAHTAADVGREFAAAVDLAREIGFRRYVTLADKEKVFHPLG